MFDLHFVLRKTLAETIPQLLASLVESDTHCELFREFFHWHALRTETSNQTARVKESISSFPAYLPHERTSGALSPWVKPEMPAYLQSFSSDSMRSRALYLATRSLRQGAPVLMIPVARPTVKSAMVTSSVSPLRCEHMTDQLSLWESCAA